MKAIVTIAEEFLASPAGEFPHPELRDGPKQVNDPVGLRTQAAGVAADIANGRPPAIDDDHALAEGRRSARPLGHIKSARLVPAGLLVNVRWFDHGIETLRLSGQRRVSPCYDQVEQLSGNRIRPLHLHSIGIVREGNMKSLPPIVNRAGGQLLMNRAMAIPFQGTSERITNRRAAEIFSAIVHKHARDHRRPFAESWNEVRNRFSVLAGLMQMPNESEGVLVNREARPAIGPYRAADDAEAQERFWAAVEQHADFVRDTFHSHTDWYGEPNSNAPWIGSAGYYEARAELRRKYGQSADPDFIWQKMREQYPAEWANYVLHIAHAKGLV